MTLDIREKIDHTDMTLEKVSKLISDFENKNGELPEKIVVWPLQRDPILSYRGKVAFKDYRDIPLETIQPLI